MAISIISTNIKYFDPKAIIHDTIYSPHLSFAPIVSPTKCSKTTF